VPAVLEKAARGELPDQRLADYRLPAGLSLLDEQGRAFRIASALWRTFEPQRARQDVDAARTTSVFILELLRDALGYGNVTTCREPVSLGDRAFPITALACGGRVPVIVAPHQLDLDQPDERFAIVGSGARRRSAYQLAQQYLNADAACTWALVTNGAQLRLVRDSDSLTRPSYLEADLELILREQRYADFAAVWRLFHATRAGEVDASSSWESWRKQGQEQGERVRDGLRDGVTQALLTFGTGFLADPANEALRARLQSGELTTDQYFQQLLRLIYRCLFVFTIEERRDDENVPLIHGHDRSAQAHQARAAYEAGYAFRRLRDRALRRSGFDKHGDLWVGCRVAFRGLAFGETRLALPALGGLFASAQCPDLDAAQLENQALLGAMRHLRWSGSGRGLAAIDYRNMGPEELGSVYESLLELVPVVDLPARIFGFVGLTQEGRTEGNARKTTGSYYTPDSLVQELLDSALEPVIAQKLAAKPQDPVGAILSISVVDPACGSGHFLLAAARRIAEKLAEVRAVEGAVTPKDYRHALREVIARCIHGVDRNPMALELARTALWLEGYEPGQPLSFLDHHLICGDALLGLMDFQSLKAGIPADAFKPLTGDDKDACRALATTNRSALRAFAQRRTTPDFFREKDTRDLLRELETLEKLPETNPLEVEVKAAQYTTFLQHARDSRLAQAADLVVGAFLAPKSAEAAELCPTTQTLADLLFPRDASPVLGEVVAHARHLCRDARVMHWPLAFAGVFGRGGFDCVLGNPPWERIKLLEQEFFASRHSAIATAPNAAARQRLIRDLATGSENDLRLLREFEEAKRLTEAASTFMHVSFDQGGRFPLTGKGDVNTYALFAETITALTHRLGRAGFIVPTGIATDDSTKTFFQSLVSNGRLHQLVSFYEVRLWFPATEERKPFCLLTIADSESAQFIYDVDAIATLGVHEKWFSLTPKDFSLLNPNTGTLSTFRSKADAELTKAIYRRVPVLIREAREGVPELNPWRISFSRMIDMSNDSALFLDERSASSLPLYEGKMIHQFDHRAGHYRNRARNSKGELVTEESTHIEKSDPDYETTPRYWVEERHVLSRIARVPRCITRAWDEQANDALQQAWAVWIVSADENDELAELRGLAGLRERVIELGGRHFHSLSADHESWLNSRDSAEAKNWPQLTADELEVVRNSPDLLSATHALLDRRSPRWLMGWRDITNAAAERTVIATVMPRVGVGNNMPLMLFDSQLPPMLYGALLANLGSLVLDFVARHKVGGTHLNYFIYKQLPILPPSSFTQADIRYVVSRVLELTYTSHDLAPWAADLGYTGRPFTFEPARRAQLRAELDAYYANLYGLTRDELRYILDPADTHGSDYPTETFRVLKQNEIAEFGEYRTRRLVLAAWDALGKSATAKVELTPAVAATVPNWMDQPLVAPSSQRLPMPPDVYRSAIVPHLLHQAGGRINFDRFRRAYWLLSEPKTLAKYGKESLGSVITAWKKSAPPPLDQTKFIPHLRGAVRDDLQFVTGTDERHLQLRRTDHLVRDDHIIFDARLALLVADLWPSSEPIAPLTAEEEKVVRELELIA